MHILLRIFLTLIAVLLVATAFVTVFFAGGFYWGTEEAGVLTAVGWAVSALMGFATWNSLK